MFYAKSAPEIRSQNTILNPNHVFTGDYWDDFALPLFFLPDSANVLILGLAGGGGIRPLFSSTKNVHLTAVDIDSVSNQSCRSYFSRYFSRIHFEIERSCAGQFLRETKGSYDAVWVDVYEPDAYWDQIYTDEFWESLKARTRPSGLIFINSFGLPIQLSPLSQSLPQKLLAEKLKRHFRYTAYIPHRRNLTLLASAKAPRWQGASPHEELNRLDKVSFDVLAARAKFLTEIQGSAREDVGGRQFLSPESLNFSVIDQHMLSSWQKVLKEVRDLGYAIHDRRELLNLIRQPNFIDAYVRGTEGDLGVFIPVLAAGQSRLMDLKLEDLLSWFLSSQEMIKAKSSVQFYQIWIPQMWNLLIGGEKRYLTYYFDYLQMLKSEGIVA